MERVLTKEDIENFNIRSIAEIDAYNNSKTQTQINLFGEKEIIGEVVQLVAYIRHALKNNLKCKIDLSIGNTVANPDFMMDVNGFQVPDLTTEKKYQIN